MRSAIFFVENEVWKSAAELVKYVRGHLFVSIERFIAMGMLNVLERDTMETFLRWIVDMRREGEEGEGESIMKL